MFKQPTIYCIVGNKANHGIIIANIWQLLQTQFIILFNIDNAKPTHELLLFSSEF